MLEAPPPSRRLQVGSDDDGYAVRLSLRDFLYYRASREHGRLDDSPLYIFDGSFATRRGSRRLRQDYSVPALFAEDLMQHAGERRRPPYRCSPLRGMGGRLFQACMLCVHQARPHAWPVELCSLRWKCTR